MRHDGGYIDNVAATRTFPTSGISQSSLVKDNYNDADTVGARAALKVDLSDNWSITPSVMFQNQKGNGIYAGESGRGDLEVAHWHPENTDDKWAQAALTVEGRISNLDVTFASSYLKRDVDVNSDYSDYSFFYDTLVPGYFGTYFRDNAGELINPSQYIQGKDGYTKTSNELRFSTSAENRWRFVGGLFAQRQTHDIQQAYQITDLADAGYVTGWDDTFWLTKQWRVDRDAGGVWRAHVRCHRQTVVHWRCALLRDREFAGGFLRLWRQQSVRVEHRRSFPASIPGQVFETAPCTNLDKTVKQNDTTFRLNATFHATDDVMFYATWSEGFRPGGVNRRGTFPPYKADFLTNYEIGWKTYVGGPSPALQRRDLHGRLG